MINYCWHTNRINRIDSGKVIGVIGNGVKTKTENEEAVHVCFPG